MRFRSEAFWVITGQALTAIGTLVGVRLLTQILAPAQYGVLSLALGMSVLAGNLVTSPLTQAAIHFYPRYSAERLSELRDSLFRGFRRFIPWITLVALIGGAYYSHSGRGSYWLVLLVLLLFALECWRTSCLSLLNAARRQRRYGLWSACDAWLRPLAAVAAVLVAGHLATAALVGYVMTSATLSLLWSRNLWPARASQAVPPQTARALDSAMWAYALPLIPLGLLAWVTTLGDRYLIGGALSVSDAGLYAAVYGLAYSPFMIVNSAAEQAIRPVYQTAVSHDDQERARRLLWLWLAGVSLVCAAGVLLFVAAHGLIARVLISPAYRNASWLMPWVALGYGIRCVSYVFERVCYAHGRTWRVLLIQVCAAATTLIVMPMAVLNFGLRGAACAVPVCFGVQCLAAALLARRTIREASGTRTAPDGLHAAGRAVS
jgi:O-antigen/teichoic acid export membrane protein